jgi:hypothetical protein
VTTSTANVWAFRGGKWVVDELLPQFSTVEVLAPSNDPAFVTVRLPNGQSATLATSELGAGDGKSAKTKWCQAIPETSPSSGEIFRQVNIGPAHATIINAGTDDAVAKFRDPLGFAIASIFIHGNSQATINDFPNGSYQLEFATGTGWSRRCGLFTQSMHAGRFPGLEIFADSEKFETTRSGNRIVAHYHSDNSYTITPVLNGNVTAEPISEDAFLRD